MRGPKPFPHGVADAAPGSLGSDASFANGQKRTGDFFSTEKYKPLVLDSAQRIGLAVGSSIVIRLSESTASNVQCCIAKQLPP